MCSADDDEAIAGLDAARRSREACARGQAISPGMKFTFPPQATSTRPEEVIYRAGTKFAVTTGVVDLSDGAIQLVWNERAQRPGRFRRRWCAMTRSTQGQSPKPCRPSLPGSSSRVAWMVLAGAPVELLRAADPRFDAAGIPGEEGFSHDVGKITPLAGQLDGSCLAVQGPPGTGQDLHRRPHDRRLAAERQAGRRDRDTPFRGRTTSPRT